jgi:4-amino-4-deoxy-L-arabinose transferase-like glycosyltransferase
LAAQEERAALTADRRRTLIHANERARLLATAIANLATAIVIAGLIAPLFDPDLRFTAASIAATALAAILLSTLAHIILGFVESETD